MTDLDVYQPPAADQYQARLAMTPEAAKALDDQLRLCTRAVLREGTDYGIIPGTNGDKVLFRPGAQKLLQWFGLGITCDCTGIERDDQGRKHGITYRATVTRQLPGGAGTTLATCEGTADYDEAKFFKPAEQVRRDAEARERGWAKKDHRVANPEKWRDLPEYRAPWNTLMKRAQKRAIVGAVIDATAAGGLFTEEDDHAPVDDHGESFYEKALTQAAEFTDIEDGKALYVDASDAHKNGLCTLKQKDHIQNRIKARAEKLKATAPVDVEDLAGGDGGE